MGIHQGMVAADASAERLVAAINAHAPRLEPGESFARLEELKLDPVAGRPMALGERAGKSYIIDAELVISSSQDLVPILSEELGGTVVFCGGETTSGTYHFAAARDGQLIRAYWNCYDNMRAAWSKGTPLASEPFEDLDGDNLIAAMGELGFDFDGWFRTGPYQLVAYSGDTLPEQGQLHEEFMAFFPTVEIPAAQIPKPKVFTRAAGAYDIVSGNSPWAKEMAPAKKGLFGLFKR